MTDTTTVLKKERARPVYRNIAMTDLMNYRFPPMAIASIFHRVTGMAVFVGMIVLLPLLAMSLKSEGGFEAFRSIIWANPVAKLVLIGLLWAMVYHLVAGVRHLIQDANCWLDKASARGTAIGGFVLSIVVTAVIVWRLW